MWTIFFTQLSFGLLALLICYSSGKIIASFFEIKGNFFFRLFVTYIFGITSIVLFYSIIKAHGRTVNVLLIPIIGYLLYYFRTSFTKKPKFDKNEILLEFAWSLLPFLFVFLYQSWFYFDLKKNELKILWSDYYAYSYFIDVLKVKGIENYQLARMFLSDNKYIGMMPYHYSELWLNAFFSITLSNNSINCYYFTVFPILVTIFQIGICSLFVNKINNKVLGLSISVLMLFVTGLSFPFFNNNYQSLIFSNAHILGYSSLKLTWIFIFVLLAVIIFHKDNVVSFIIFSSIPFFSSSFLPAIWGGMLLFLLMKFFILFPKIDRKYFLLFIYVSLLLCIYTIFYHFFSDNSINTFLINVVNKNPFMQFLHKGINMHTIKIFIGNFCSFTPPYPLSNFSFILYLSPFVALLIPVVLKRNIELWGLCFCFYIGGLFASILFYGMLDSNQFSTNLISILIILIIVGLIYMIDNYSQHKLSILILIPLLLYSIFIGKYSPKYNEQLVKKEDNSFLKNVSNCITEQTVVVCVFFNKDKYNKLENKFYWWAAYNDFKLLSQYSKSNLIFVIGNPELYLTNKVMSTNDSLVYFNYSPINVWRANGKSFTLQSYIRKYNIKYFCFQPQVDIPSFIKQNIDTVISSSKTGCSFIKIK